MQINVIPVGSVESFDYLLYGEQNPVNSGYFQNQIQNFSSTLNDVGRRFIEGSREVYARINDSEVARLARLAVSKVKNIFHPNSIVPLETLDELRVCQPMMQRYMMANPVIRQLYHEQRCDGYSDSYVDLHPKQVGKDHYDYRRVMNGMIQDTVVDGQDSWSVTCWLDDTIEGDRELLFSEKSHILSSWELAELFIAQGTDPTSIYSENIG